jgi:hypothetical protein
LVNVISVAVLLAGCVCAGEDEGELRIGVNPKATGPREISVEEFQAAIKRLMEAPAGKGDASWEKSADAALFARQVYENVELYTRLLIPPGYPKAVSKSDKAVRARAAVVLGLSRDSRAVQPLVDSAVYDPDDGVRLVSAKALKSMEEPIALRKLVDLAIAKDFQKYPWSVRKSACKALKRYGDPAAIERIMRELSYELAGGNQFDPKNPTRGVPAGIGTENALGVPTGTPNIQLSEQDMYPALSALKELTGAGFYKNEKDFKTWQVWWTKEAAKFKFGE